MDNKTDKTSAAEPGPTSKTISLSFAPGIGVRAKRYFGIRFLVFSSMSIAFFFGLFRENTPVSFVPQAVALFGAYVLAVKGALPLIAINILKLGGQSRSIVQLMGLPALIVLLLEQWEILPSSFCDPASALLGGAFFCYLAAGAYLGRTDEVLGAVVIQMADESRLERVSKTSRKKS